MKVATQAFLPMDVGPTWRMLLRWEDQALWMKDADSVRVVTAHREGVGVRIAVKTRVLGVPLFSEQLEVSVWEPPMRLVLVHRSFVRGEGEWRLEAAEGGCSFTWSETLSLPVPLLGEVLLLGYRPFMRRLMRGALANLQGLVAREAT